MLTVERRLNSVPWQPAALLVQVTGRAGLVGVALPTVQLAAPLGWLLVLLAVPVPLSAFTPASSQKPAPRPPPRSSTPRKPTRDWVLAPCTSRVVSAMSPLP